MITTTDIVSFILRHRGKTKCFSNWPVENIEIEVTLAIMEQRILVDFKPCSEQIISIVIAERNDETKTLHISQALSRERNNPANLRILAQWSSKNFPGFSLTATRHGKLKRYNTSKFYRKVGV